MEEAEFLDEVHCRGVEPWPWARAKPTHTGVVSKIGLTRTAESYDNPITKEQLDGPVVKELEGVDDHWLKRWPWVRHTRRTGEPVVPGILQISQYPSSHRRCVTMAPLARYHKSKEARWKE